MARRELQRDCKACGTGFTASWDHGKWTSYCSTVCARDGLRRSKSGADGNATFEAAKTSTYSLVMSGKDQEAKKRLAAWLKNVRMDSLSMDKWYRETFARDYVGGNA